MNYSEGNIFFIGDFDEQLEQNVNVALIKEIQKQRALRFGRLDFYINSFGGQVHVADKLVALIETAKADDITVRTIVTGVAFSAGSYVAVTGTPGERYIAKGAEHMIHYGTTGSMEQTPMQIERMAAWKRRQFSRTLAHYNKYCNVPNLDAEMMDDGYFVHGKRLLTYGLADKWMDKFDIGYDE